MDRAKSAKKSNSKNYTILNLRTSCFMLNPEQFGVMLEQAGFDFFAGVPCSFLTPLINVAMQRRQFVMSANEGDAVAICAGAHLAGKKPVFLCQNSGLTNASSPLTSLNHPFRIPLLGFIGSRGEMGGMDGPQHQLMGKIQLQFLASMEIDTAPLNLEPEVAQAQFRQACNTISKGRSFFFTIRKNSFLPRECLTTEIQRPTSQYVRNKTDCEQSPTQRDALKVLSELRQKATAILTTTGYTGRQLYQINDHQSHFYMIGSMGCVSSIGLGLSLCTPKCRVISIDGDGALLMRLAAMPTIGHYGPGNLLHLLLDNGQHESTGGHPTVSPGVDFISIAKAVGYARSIYLHDLDELRDLLVHWQARPTLTFAHLKIRPELRNLPGLAIKPHELTKRLMDFLHSLEEWA